MRESMVFEEYSENLPWDPLVVGGSNAPASGIAYQVSLRSLLNSHFCGGSIISSTWVLSAAHCTQRTGNSINVLMATNTLNAGGITIRSSRIVNHPQYNSRTLENDVSVVQVSSPFVMSDRVQVIDMGSALAGGGLLATLTGWGTTSEPGSVPNHLQIIQLSTLTNADCRARHTAANAAMVFDSKICTFTRTGEGACRGDSGGPLVVGTTQIGIVSWGIPCGRGFPDAFDRVSSHRAWILAQIA